MMADKDISSILSNWEYKPGEVTVRKIRGLEGHTKLQMRLELGLLQMEMEGRPDGARPFNKESLLAYYLDLLDEHKQFFGSEEGFELDAEACAALRQESLLYYYRYLGLFQLGEYEKVVQDTGRNLQVFDLIWRYAAEESDRMMLEQYRPYVIMMNSRSKALINLQNGNYDHALRHIEGGIAAIESLLTERGWDDLVESCAELHYLRKLYEEISEKKPLTRHEKLKRLLQQAVDREDYEHAAKLRDAIRGLE